MMCVLGGVLGVDFVDGEWCARVARLQIYFLRSSHLTYTLQVQSQRRLKGRHTKQTTRHPTLQHTNVEMCSFIIHQYQ